MDKNNQKSEQFRELLEQNYQWPDYYVWKFIVKIEIQDHVLTHLSSHEVNVKVSEKGNYVSISARKLVTTTDEVLEVYEIISRINGVMSL
jgi:putative lipoic acid-binding regulatory protein